MGPDMNTSEFYMLYLGIQNSQKHSVDSKKSLPKQYCQVFQ